MPDPLELANELVSDSAAFGDAEKIDRLANNLAPGSDPLSRAVVAELRRRAAHVRARRSAREE